MCRSIVALVVLASVVLFVGPAKAGEYTYLQYARGEMKNALQILESAPAKLHGHKESATKALKEAMAEVDAALRFVGITIYYEAPSIKVEKGLDRLPECLKVIREARDKLSEGGAGFGRHRMSAIRAIDRVITELESGLAKRDTRKSGKGGKKRASQ